MAKIPGLGRWFGKSTEKLVTAKELVSSTAHNLNKSFLKAYGANGAISNLKAADDLINKSNAAKLLPREMLEAAREEAKKSLGSIAYTAPQKVINVVDSALNKQLKKYQEGMKDFSYFLNNPYNYFKNKSGAFKEVKYDYNFGDAANGVYKTTEKAAKNSVGKVAKKAVVGTGVAGAAIYGANKLTEYELEKPKLKTQNKDQQQIITTKQPQEDYGQQYSNEYQDDSSNYPDGAQDNFDVQDSYDNIKLPKKKNNLQLNSNNLDPDIKKLLNKTNTNNGNYFNYTKDNSIVNYLSLYHGLYNNIK